MSLRCAATSITVPGKNNWAVVRESTLTQERAVTIQATARTVFARLDRMRTVTLALPAFGFVLSTRAALGAGLALLVADRLPSERRRAIGLGLVALGLVTTVPAVRWISQGVRASHANRVKTDSRLIGATRLARKGDDIP